MIKNDLTHINLASSFLVLESRRGEDVELETWNLGGLRSFLPGTPRSEEVGAVELQVTGVQF